jgi:5-deoxy-5-amino-3-dehydroquinate synthase
VRTVTVELGPRSYPVVVGPGARLALPEHVPARSRRAALVTQEDLGIEVDPGIEWRRFVVGQGEEAKSLPTVERLCSGMAAWGLSRADVVVGVGGGVVTDVAGFVAAVYLRGVAAIHVATTLVAQIDAAIGGKTGVNLSEGKNLVGAFWQPRAVLCDTDVLATLPRRERLNGLGEMAKYALLGEAGLERLPIEEQVARAAAIKARLVSVDELDTSGSRALLNYGHTLGHALEWACVLRRRERPSSAPDLRHGEAVAVGLVFAAVLARVLGRVGEEAVLRHREVVSAYELPSSVPGEITAAELLELMAKDKKAVDGLTFVLDGPRGPEVVPGVATGAVLEALREVGAS